MRLILLVITKILKNLSSGIYEVGIFVCTKFKNEEYGCDAVKVMFNNNKKVKLALQNS